MSRNRRRPPRTDHRPAGNDHTPGPRGRTGRVVEAEAAGDRFRFEWPKGSGRYHTLKPSRSVKTGTLRRAMRADNELAQMFALLEVVATKEAMAAIDDMTLAELDELFTDWQAHSGVTVGESSSSST